MCSIGINLKEECSKESPWKDLNDLESQKSRLIKVRTSCFEAVDICRLHERKYLNFFAMREKVCCDPLDLHGDIIRRKSLREIDCRMMDKCAALVELIPGKKLCGTCRKAINKKLDA